jgi:hypothetical protein
VNAWLLTWEGTSGPAVSSDRKIVAILSARRSSGDVAAIVDTLYCRTIDSAYGMATLANKRSQRERQYKHLGSTSQRFFYGRNPCIFARVVSKLTVERDEAQSMEIVRWVEVPIYANAETGSGIVEVVAAHGCQHARSRAPLTQEAP